jgi:hypothetical protein
MLQTAQTREELASQEEETRALFDRLTQREDDVVDRVHNASIEFMSTPQQDEAQERLDALRAELAEERARFTQATVKLGHDRLALDEDRRALQEERRQWEVDRMLSELPPTPAAEEMQTIPEKPVALVTRAPRPIHSPRKQPGKVAPRRSPVKPIAGPSKASIGPQPTKVHAGGKKTRRRSSLLEGVKGFSLSPSKRDVVVSPFETEYVATKSNVAVEQLSLPAVVDPKGVAAPLITSTFAFPPPSPLAKLPLQDELFSRPTTSDASAPAAAMNEAHPPLAANTTALPVSQPPAVSAVAETPSTRPFPLAKPHARNMIHAYSPARPSPLSRILLLANSPGSPDSIPFTPMSRLDERSEGDDGMPDESPTPALPHTGAPHTLSLEEELGLIDEDSPLREMPVEPNRPPARKTGTKSGERRQTRQADAQEKGRASVAPRTASTATVVTTEKENDTRKATRATGSRSGAVRSSALPGGRAPATAPLQVGKPKDGAVTKTKAPPVVLPRRVPVDGSAPSRRPFS